MHLFIKKSFIFPDLLLLEHIKVFLALNKYFFDFYLLISTCTEPKYCTLVSSAFGHLAVAFFKLSYLLPCINLSSSVQYDPFFQHALILLSVSDCFLNLKLICLILILNTQLLVSSYSHHAQAFRLISLHASFATTIFSLTTTLT